MVVQWNIGQSYNERTRSSNYSLVNDYSSLFTVQGENSSESIFELQISGTLQTPKWVEISHRGSKTGMHFGWFRVSAFP